MLLLCLYMLAGAYSLTMFAHLPALSFFYATLAAAMVCSPWCLARPAAYFLLGFTLMGFSASAHKSDQLPAVLQNETFALNAVIADFPLLGPQSVRFVARPLNRPDLPALVRLTWMDPVNVPAIGETWRLTLRLRPPRGYLNPAGFDFEAWLFRNRIGASGYVITDMPGYKIHGAPIALVDRIRSRFVARVEHALPRDDAAAVLMAIGVGARQHITRDQWDLFAHTGTSHLMAISGLHIGLAAGCAYCLCRILLVPLCRSRNMKDLAVIGALVTAAVYAAASGFGVPAMRACLMAVVVAFFVLARRRIRAATVLALSCLLIFLADPLSILSPGFKLSFAAVAILFLVAGQHVRTVRPGRLPIAGPWASGFERLVRLQVALLVGLLPLTVVLFDRVSIAAPAVNLLVLPIFNFVTVPLTLAGALLDGPLADAGSALLGWAHRSVQVILWLVGCVGEWRSAGLRTRELGLLLTAVAAVTAIFVLLPPGWPGRRLALIAAMCIVNHRPAPPPAGCLDYYVLDVGQGLAVVLRTTHHALLFDTGPAFTGGGSTADLVVLPFLYQHGIDRLDWLIISHGDLDHAGGAATVTENIPVAEILVGQMLADAGFAQRRCSAGMRWSRDGVTYTVIHPRQGAPWDRNNASCVLMAAIGEYRILLTGDIETPAEKLLLHRNQVGETEVVVVPHHGSMTSSGEAFVARLGADVAIVSAGFGNRWGLPRPTIVKRWQSAGARVLNTATDGAVAQRICQAGGPGKIRLERRAARKFWHDAPPPGP